MTNLRSANNPVLRFLGKLPDLMILNLLTLLCSIPVITGGAALTALHASLLRLHRDEEGFKAGDFLRFFRQFFKPATWFWLLYLLLYAILGAGLWVAVKANAHGSMYTILVILFLFVLAGFLYTFPLLSHFEEPMGKTLVNAMKTSIIYFPQTGGMAGVWLVFGLLYGYLKLVALPFFLLFGIGLPVFFCVMIYDKPFRELEVQQLEPQPSEIVDAEAAKEIGSEMPALEEHKAEDGASEE